MPTKYFTLEEANSYLPWLESMFQRLEQVQERLMGHQQEVTGLMRKGRRNGSSSVEKEIVSRQEKLGARAQEARPLLEEIAGKGIIVRDVARGLVDFPHLRESREVHLCWLRGEDTIHFWHKTDAGFAGRQPL